MQSVVFSTKVYWYTELRMDANKTIKATIEYNNRDKGATIISVILSKTTTDY